MSDSEPVGQYTKLNLVANAVSPVVVGRYINNNYIFDTRNNREKLGLNGLCLVGRQLELDQKELWIIQQILIPQFISF